MHRILSALFSCVVVFMSLVSCGRGGLYGDRLKALDGDVRNYSLCAHSDEAVLMPMYEALVTAWTDSLEWEAAYSLFDYWYHRNTDSTLFYLDRMMNIQWDSELIFRSKVCRAKATSVSEAFKLETFLPEIIPLSAGGSFKLRYCSTMIDIYSRNTSLSSYHSHYADCLESAIEVCEAPDTLLWYQGLRAMAYNETSEALRYLTQAYEMTEDVILKGACAEAIADIYVIFGNPVLEKKWLIDAAGHQLRGGEGELRSLYRLSLLLSDEGDFSRAAKYIRTVIERAASAGFPDLVLDSATGSLAITTTLDKIDSTRQNVLFAALGGQ